MKATVYCKTTARGVQTYYLNDGKRDYYLLKSGYHRSNRDFFSQGRSIQEVVASRKNKSTSVRKARDRLLGAIKYIESEYGLCLLQKTAKKANKRRHINRFDDYIDYEPATI